jgi:hypothetical protein
MIASELFKEKTPGLYFARIIHYSLTTRAVLPPGRGRPVTKLTSAGMPAFFNNCSFIFISIS